MLIKKHFLIGFSKIPVSFEDSNYLVFKSTGFLDLQARADDSDGLCLFTVKDKNLSIKVVESYLQLRRFYKKFRLIFFTNKNHKAVVDAYAHHPFIDFFDEKDIKGCASYLNRINSYGYTIKRKHLRKKTDLEVEVRFEKLEDILPNAKSTSPWFKGKLADISKSGAKISVEGVVLKENQFVFIKILNKNNKIQKEIEAQVRWKQKSMGHRSQVGVQFVVRAA